MPALHDLLPDVDARFERLQREAGIPGVAWGVVHGAELVHGGGAGTLRDGDDRRPDADHVFRIASMTKSFTATTVLLLRDAGLLRLDDPVATYVPDLADWRPPTTDSPAVTVRHLLTMSAGLPTDDPWGDRQQGLALDDFGRLLASGPTFAWPPGTAFDYSNLGYGILGRVISAVAGEEYRMVVRDRLLRPLGMTSTAFVAEDVEDARLAHGYVRRGEALIREGTDGYGALASMGGLFSSVRDLARWIAGFLDAFPARDGPEGPHPLRRASRREMQQVHRAFGATVPAHPADAEPRIETGGYGFGLFVLHDVELGTIIGHAGGYPGFGSHMAWHPATGLGVIALGNLRYAPVRPVANEMLAMLVRAGAVERREVVPSPAVVAARPMVDGLVDRWDEAVADRLFAMNVDLDEPRERRRDTVTAIARDLGPFQPDDKRPARSDSPAHLAWWLRGVRGWVRVSILVTPEPSPRVQELVLTPVGDPSPGLRRLAERALALATMSDAAWPDDLVAGPGLDTSVVLRGLRSACVRFGPMTLGQPCAGDGQTTSTFELETGRGPATLRVGLEPAEGTITAMELLVAERAATPEGW